MTFGSLCKGHCQVCEFPARHRVRFMPNDRFRINSPECIGHGTTGIIERIFWQPCRGNWYIGRTDDGVFISTNDQNFELGYRLWEKVGKQETLAHF